MSVVQLFARTSESERARAQGGSVEVDGRMRSYVTLPGYRKGQKPGNYGKRYPAEVLTKDEMLRLLDACGKGFAADRNRALFTVLWRTGLRIAESLALLPKDVDLGAGRLTVLHGKGDKRRVVGIDAQTVAVLEEWSVERVHLAVGRDCPVFCVVTRPSVGRPMHPSCVREALRDAAARAGIEKRVHPHGLRHTYAAELAMEGVPIHVIGALLGHANAGTTARYIDHLSNDQAVEVARARLWVVEDKEPARG